MDELMYFMTSEDAIDNQDGPIRLVTAEVYVRRVKLFLGWYLSNNNLYGKVDITFKDIFPTKKKKSAEPVIDYHLWLINVRNASTSYCSIVQTGLIKLVKFIYSTKNLSRNQNRSRSYENIPLVAELRLMHTLSQKMLRNSKRVSNEMMKWMEWPEFLSIINEMKNDTEIILDRYSSMCDKDGTPSSKCQYAAYSLQKYLLMVLFSALPDRQRTFRELEIDSTFIREDNQWVVKHESKDYKTGNAYGDRPALKLPEQLTSTIDYFIDKWRPHLLPQSQESSFLFFQESTGQPLTSDSIYQIVERSCYKYNGKRTNPHLLRSMVVTHIRKMDGITEKELESLALYMGHSVSGQRQSYYRESTLNHEKLHSKSSKSNEYYNESTVRAVDLVQSVQTNNMGININRSSKGKITG